MMMSVEMKAKCTTCKKTFVMTPAGMEEARDIGCAFSPCCGAVATVEAVTVKQPARSRQGKGAVDG
jgi:hypothetical protein